MDRSEWKAKGGEGHFKVWHAGKNLYYVTDDRSGEVLGQRQYISQAFALAGYHYRLNKNYGQQAA